MKWITGGGKMMSQHPSELNRAGSQDESTAVSFWDELEKAGKMQMRNLIVRIRLVAPVPGKLLYVTAKKLPFELDEMEPVMLSSLDVTTHLQIARIYMTSSLAAATEFLDFITAQYPFPIDEIRTYPNWLFSDSSLVQARHRFTSYAAQKGIRHSILLDPSDDPIYRIVKNFFFGSVFERSLVPFTQERLMDEVINFLFFHNNHRSLPTLGGQTPIQMLQSFAEYRHIEHFDPYAPTRSLHVR